MRSWPSKTPTAPSGHRRCSRFVRVVIIWFPRTSQCVDNDLREERLPLCDQDSSERCAFAFIYARQGSQPFDIKISTQTHRPSLPIQPLVRDKLTLK